MVAERSAFSQKLGGGTSRVSDISGTCRGATLSTIQAKGFPMRRITPATVLILLIFGVATVLAWQAYQSALSHRRSAERVLNDYVQFAAWEFGRLSQASLED